MNNNQNRNNLGDQFKSAVQDAINKGDFQHLNDLVSDTVTDVIAEAGWQVKKTSEQIQREFKTSSHTDVYKNTQNYQEQQAQRNQQFTKNRPSKFASRKLMPVTKTKNIGQISNILYIIFGGVGAAFSILGMLIGLIFTAIDWAWPIGVYVFLFLLLLFSGLIVKKGMNERNRLSRLKRYIALCGDNMYVNIKYLADQTGKSTGYVLKDVKKMMHLGFFPEGHLDEKETCLMLDDSTYREYLNVEKERKALAQEEAFKKATQTASAPDMDEKTRKELQTMLAEGQDYIQKLHYLNDQIEGEVISQKLYRMEDLLKEIFERVQEDPDQMPKMRKLMNYYLPTTIKLLQAYEEFDGVSAPGEDIISAKTEIEKTVDIINEAFTELLNKLFQTSAFDAAADAQVLQTMLAKEGLTKNKITEE